MFENPDFLVQEDKTESKQEDWNTKYVNLRKLYQLWTLNFNKL